MSAIWEKVLLTGIGTAGTIVAGYFTADHFHHNYERDYSVKPEDTVLDIGASVGRFTKRYADRFAMVVAIEPEPRNIDTLRKMARSYRNILVVPLALWNKREMLALHVSRHPGFHTVLAREVMVQADTLDNLTSSLGLDNIDFIKMDVEGAELEILEGGEETLDKTRNIAVSSYHVRDGRPTYNRVVRFLERHNFEVKRSTLLPPLMGIVYGKRE